MILVRGDLEFELKSIKVDTEGRYILMDAVVQAQSTFSRISMLQTRFSNKAYFFSNVNKIIENCAVDLKQNVVIGGDSNVAFDPHLDCSGGTPQKKIQ